MRYNAVIYASEPGPSSSGAAAVLDEIGSVGTRQIADRGRVVSRLYTAALAKPRAFPTGQPVWVAREGQAGPELFIAYPVLQKGRVLRLHRREGELVPGLLLEPLGTYERGGSPLVTGGGEDGGEWFITQDGPNVYRTTDFRLYEDVAALRGKLSGSLCWAGSRLIAGGTGEVFVTSDGVDWQTHALPEAAEIHALAWDGGLVWIAGEGGAFTLSLETGTITEVSAQPTYGLTYQFMNFDLFRAEGGAGGVYGLVARNGTFLRTLALELSSLRHNWVVLNGQHFVSDETGRVWRFDAAAMEEIGVPLRSTVFRSGRDTSLEPATFLIRDTVLAVSLGRLGLVTGGCPPGEVRTAYDFGGDVQAYPAQGGFIVIRTDGLLYRVRRV